MNSTSKPGSRISSSILMTSSSWQTARHRMGAPTFDYTPGRVAFCAADGHDRCRVHSMYRLVAARAVVLAWAAVDRGRAAQQVPVFRGGIDLVNVGVTVTDRRGNLLSDLQADDFEVYEDGRKQTIRYFAAGLGSDAGPETHLGILLDVSESMGDDIAFTK